MTEENTASKLSLQQQVLKYEYVLEALSDIGEELCRVTSFDAQLKSLLHLLLGTLGVRKGGIFIIDGLRKKISMRCSWKLSHKLFEQDLTHKELSDLESFGDKIVFKVSDFPHFQSLLNAFQEDALDSVSILKVRERLIGFLIVGGKLKGVSLSDKEMNFLEVLSRNISVAINNYLLLSDLRETNIRLDEKMQEVSILYQASQMISSEIQLQALLDMAMSAISEIMDIERGSIWLYEPDSNSFALMSQLGNQDVLVKLPEKMHVEDSSVLGYALSKSSHFTSSEKDLVNKPSNSLDEEVFGSAFVVIPIVYKGDFLGLVSLSSNNQDGTMFSSRDMRLMTVFAIQLGVAVKNAQLYEQAITDGMTKLYLHRYFKQRLSDEFKRAARFKRSLALIMIDIDHFKKLNDQYGHQAGDEVLKQVAVVLRRAVRTHDLPVRYGGEEFALLLPETDIVGAVAVAERVRHSIESLRIEIESSKVLTATASFGVAVYPDSANDEFSLLRASDVALYWSKEHGRNQVTAAPFLPQAKPEQPEE